MLIKKIKNSIRIHIIEAKIPKARNIIARMRLTNRAPIIIANNCLGGFIYHWLKCQFLSPFINLRMTPDDFITAIEHFSEFMSQKLIEDTEMSKKYGYPVGRGYMNTYIHFSHYKSFQEANDKWEIRKQRMNNSMMLKNGTYDLNAAAFMLSSGQTVRKPAIT